MPKISETIADARAPERPSLTTPIGRTLARDASGDPVTIRSTSAVCFCADGAVALAAGVQVNVFGQW